MKTGIYSPPKHSLYRTSVWLSDPFCFTPWYTAALAQSLTDAGVELRLMCGDFVREPDYFAGAGLHPEHGPLHFSSALSRPRLLQRALRTSEVVLNTSALLFELRKGKHIPDILHLQQLPLLNHGVHTDFMLIESAQRAGITVVHTVHNVLPHDTGDRLRAVYARLYHSVDHLVCHSASTAARLRDEFNIPARKMSIISHGPLFATTQTPTAAESVQSRIALGLPTDRSIVLWQGVIAPYKGLDVLLHAWQLLLLGWRERYGPEPLLVIAGAGPADLMASTTRSAAMLGSSVRTDLRYIASSELPNYYKAADLLVYPYSSITTSGALLTGMSYGKPIVASDLPCFRDYLTHGQNALLVEPGEAHELAAALALLLLDHTRGKGLTTGIYERLLQGSAGNRNRYESWAEIGLHTRALYDALLTQKRDRACA